MKCAKLTACTTAVLLSSTTLIAQEARGQSFQNVYVDVDGAAVLIPADLALEACGLDALGIQQAATSRFEDSGIDSAMIQDMYGDAGASGGMGPAADTGGASATIVTDGAMAADGAASADSETTTPGAASNVDSMATGAGTTMTADANRTTDAGNATTDLGNQPAEAGTTTSADVGTASGAAGTTDTATADASGAAGQNLGATQSEGTDMVVAENDTQAGGGATAGTEIQNVEPTAADTTDSGMTTNAQSTADATTAELGSEFLALAVCQVDVVRASELGIPANGNEPVTD